MEEDDLLDSIFADLDDETWTKLDTRPRKPGDRSTTITRRPANGSQDARASRLPLTPLSGSAVRSVACKRSHFNVGRTPTQHAARKVETDDPELELDLGLERSTADTRKTTSVADAALLESIDWSDDEGQSHYTQRSGGAATLTPRQSSAGEAGQQAKVAEHAASQPDPSIPISQRYTRGTVKSVSEKTLINFRRKKVLVIEVESDKTLRRVILFDEWATTLVDVGDTVNVIGSFEVLPSTIDTDAPASESDGDGDDHLKDLSTCILSYYNENMIIVHPDVLVSATRVSDAPICRRKAVVQEKLRGPSSETPALVYGNLLHELFQTCLLKLSKTRVRRNDPKDKQSAFDESSRWATIDKLLQSPKNIESLFTIGVELDAAREYLRDKSTGFADFADRFVAERPKEDSYLSDPRIRQADAQNSTRFCVSTVHDIEEEIWSPRLGMKGKIDASVQATLLGPPSREWPLGKELKGALPLEIKSGRSIGQLQHRAQTMLYTQLMSDRYNRPVEAGLLYYTQTNTVMHVEAARNELRGLVAARNEIARCLAPIRDDPPNVSGADDSAHGTATSMPVEQSHMLQDSTTDARGTTDLPVSGASSLDEDDALWAELDKAETQKAGAKQSQTASSRRSLPDGADEERTCKRCYASDGCMLYRRAVEGVQRLSDDPESALQQQYSSKTGHLTQNQCDFFAEWERLLSLEEREMTRFRKEIWTMTANKRQRSGRCLANLAVDPLFDSTSYAPSASPGGSYFVHRLVRSGQAPFPQNGSNLALASTQLSQFASEHGPLQSFCASQINVGDPVIVSIEGRVLGLARGVVMEVEADQITLKLDHSLNNLPGNSGESFHTIDGLVYRVDKDELQSGMGRLRDNLAQLFYADGDEKRRRLVVDLESPKFKDLTDAEALRITANAQLNEDQLAAVSKVLTAKDYALILGMPGTGKTTTTAEVIKALVARGKTVLLTSYTHSAVDNILLKIMDCGFDILRLGNVEKVMPALAHLTLAGKEPPTSVAQLEHRYFSPRVVATTALSVDHPLFSRRKFDYCIVDEASQLTLPTCLGPLRFADTFVLVGDHNQLPPLVKNATARSEGLETSLFRRLSEAHPAALTYLTRQYRMNADIMALSNTLVYDGMLKCGTDVVAGRGLQVPFPAAVPACTGCAGQSCWLREVMQESRKVVFLDTDCLPARESRAGRLVQNDKEGFLVQELASTLLRCGVEQKQLGIIAMYNQQTKLLSQLMQGASDVEILTADRSQGRDKDCVIMSMTRSNTEGHVGDLLLDWRRLNVCFTRAKQKLVIIGSKSTLLHVPLLGKFFDLIERNGWLYALAPGSENEHQVAAKSETSNACGAALPEPSDAHQSNLSSCRMLSSSIKRSASTSQTSTTAPKPVVILTASQPNPSKYSTKPARLTPQKRSKQLPLRLGAPTGPTAEKRAHQNRLAVSDENDPSTLSASSILPSNKKARTASDPENAHRVLGARKDHPSKTGSKSALLTKRPILRDLINGSQ